MPAEPATPRRFRRWPLVRWLVAWAVLSSLGTLFHWAGWILPHEDPTRSVFLGQGAWREVGNLFAVAAAPGWLIATRTVGLLMGYKIEVALFANFFSWALWLLLLRSALEARRRLAHPKRNELESAGGITNRSRRAVVVNTVFGGGALLAGGGVAMGTAITPWQIKTARYRIPIRGLPAGLDGLRMVQLTDTHLGPRVPASHIENAVRIAVSLRPDVVLLTGDYIHNGVAQIDPGAELMRPLCELGVPVIGVLGNHDWYADGDRMAKALQVLGVRMIDDDRVFLDAATRRLVETDTPGSCLCFAGLSDLWMRKPNPIRAFDGVDPSTPRVVLAHNPDTAELATLLPASGRRLDVMLSGHTHGGQVALPFIGRPIVPSNYRQKYAYGLVSGPSCPVVVSAGIGMSLFPIRLGVPPEVVEVTLTRLP